MSINRISDRKQKLIDEFQSTPPEIGDGVYVQKNHLFAYSSKTDLVMCKVIAYNPEEEMYDVSYEHSDYKIPKARIVKKAFHHIGASPFVEEYQNVQSIKYTMESILFNLGLLDTYDKEKYHIGGFEVKNINWNPFVYDKDGNKQYYQRDFVWGVKEKQTLIESVYQGISCGSILLRDRSWQELETLAEKGETELAFHDIVDGKQRLKTFADFVNNVFPDAQGNYFNDLCVISQYHFLNGFHVHYSILPENTPDDVVIRQFLKMNFMGIPQSAEHINFVKSLIPKL